MFEDETLSYVPKPEAVDLLVVDVEFYHFKKQTRVIWFRFGLLKYLIFLFSTHFRLQTFESDFSYEMYFDYSFKIKKSQFLTAEFDAVVLVCRV